MKLVSLLVISFIILISSYSCTRDQIEEVALECDELVTYDNQIRPLIINSCAYAGCHAGGAPGNFTTYTGLTGYINNGRLESRAIIARDMPPVYAILGPSSLMDEELELIKCWVQAGYPEN